jgi:hypothetical protein
MRVTPCKTRMKAQSMQMRLLTSKFGVANHTFRVAYIAVSWSLYRQKKFPNQAKIAC